MNKYRTFLFRILAETCLKMDYFANKSFKSPTAGGSNTRHPFRFNKLENVQRSYSHWTFLV